MYQLYIEKSNSFSKDLVGEYEDLEDAQVKAKQKKAEDSSIRYIIEETDGSFNSYGDLITYVVEKG